MKTRDQIKSELDGANAVSKAAKAKVEEIERELRKHDSETNVQMEAECLVQSLHSAFIGGRVRVEGCHVEGGIDRSLERRFDLHLIDGTRFTIKQRTYRA